MTHALIIVDYQNDFAEGGALAIPGARALAPAIASHIEMTRSQSGLIIATRDWHPEGSVHFLPKGKWPVHCLADTHGSDYIDGINPNSIDFEIFKGYANSDDGYSGFEGVTHVIGTKEDGFQVASDALSLEDVLRNTGIRTLKIVGLATNFCVYATARDAHERGYTTILPRDGIAGIDIPGLPSQDDRLQELAQSGVKIVP